LGDVLFLLAAYVRKITLQPTRGLLRMYATLLSTVLTNQCAGILLDTVAAISKSLERAIRNTSNSPSVEFLQASV
jgi:hypothetical protein